MSLQSPASTAVLACSGCHTLRSVWLQLPEGLQFMLQSSAEAQEGGSRGLSRGSLWAGASHWRYQAPAQRADPDSQAESKPAPSRRYTHCIHCSSHQAILILSSTTWDFHGFDQYIRSAELRYTINIVMQTCKDQACGGLREPAGAAAWCTRPGTSQGDQFESAASCQHPVAS